MLIYGVYTVSLDVVYQNTFESVSDSPILICEKDDCIFWKNTDLNVRFIDAQSSFGKTLLDFYQANKNSLIFDDEGIQTILTDTTLQDFRKYLIGLQNYRAGYRPADPPAHSEDDPRDLSPNAM